MQTSCPNCSNRLVVDDAKVPATPFMLKCPKCQGMVKLPGRGAQPAPQAAPPSPPPSPAAAARPAPPPPGPPAASAPPPSESAPAPSPAPAAPTPPQAPPTLAPPQAPPAPQAAPPAPVPPPAAIASPASPVGKAIVSVPAPDQTSSLGAMLTRLRFSVDQFEPGDDRMLRLQQGDYAIVAASRNGVPDERNAYRMVQTLPPEIRRRVFLLLVGDEFQTGEGSQAFAVQADLVLNTKDLGQCDRLLTQALHERRRLYQTYWDAEDRKTEGRL